MKNEKCKMQNEEKGLLNKDFHILHFAFCTLHSRRRVSGQAATELVIILPLFLILAAALLSVGYICWQGIKVQQAANLAARIQGQERVSGAYAPMNANASVGVNNIKQDNGTEGTGDQIPDMSVVNSLASADGLAGYQRPPAGGVYGKYYNFVRDMFNPGEQKKLLIPSPKEGINTDAVEVARVMVPPKLFGFQMNPVMIEATAYGGEDPHAFGLPRWGRTTNAPTNPFYQSAIKNNPGTD